MSSYSLSDVLKNKKEGEEWYSFQLPEEVHAWTLKHKWQPGVFKKYGAKLGGVGVMGIDETGKKRDKFSKLNRLFLSSGHDIENGFIETVTVTKAGFRFRADSAIEANEILEELSKKVQLNVWMVKSMNLFLDGNRDLYFKRHNPNGTGTSLYFFRVTEGKKSRLYPLVSLNEQLEMTKLMQIDVAQCKAVKHTEMVHECALAMMKKDKKKGWEKRK